MGDKNPQSAFRVGSDTPVRLEEPGTDADVAPRPFPFDESRLTHEEAALLEAAVADTNGTLAVRSNDIARLLSEIVRLREEVERLSDDVRIEREAREAAYKDAEGAEAREQALREALMAAEQVLTTLLSGCEGHGPFVHCDECEKNGWQKAPAVRDAARAALSEETKEETK